MAQAQIRINQPAGPGTGSPGKSRDDLVLSSVIELRNVDDNGVQRWFWSMLDKPDGSSAAISNPTSAVATFTPDVHGTYRVMLRVNAGLTGEVDRRTAIVRDPAGFREPAYLEEKESNFEISPGVFNEIGWLAEVRRRMTSSDNRDDRYEILALAGGGGILDFDLDWPLPDALVAWLEMTSSSSTAVQLTVYADAARTELMYDSTTVDPSVNDWFENSPFVVSRTQSNGVENGKVYFRVQNKDAGASDVFVGWRIQAL